MNRVCTEHFIEIVSLRPSDFKWSEVLICKECRAKTKGHQVKHWYITSDNGGIIGVAGKNSGGYIALTPDEWADIPDQIRDAISELEKENADPDTKPQRWKSNHKRLDGLNTLLGLVPGEEE